MPYTLEQFAAGIKAQYPQYKDWPDDYLAREMLTKFPQYKAWIGGAAPGKPQPPGEPQDFVSRFGRNVQQDIGGIPRGISQMLQAVHPRYVANRQAGEDPISAGIHANVEALMPPTVQSLASVSTPGLIQRMAKGEDPAKITADMTTFMMTPEMAEARGAVNRLAEAGGIMRSPATTMASAADTASVLTDVINPGQKIPEFEKALSRPQAMDAVLDWADRNRRPIRTPQTLIDAMRGATDELRTHFNERIVGPNRRVSVSPSQIPDYAGRRAADGSVTLGDLHDRLGQISAQLDPAYQREVRTGEEAVKAKDAGALKAERDAIRTVYYRELSKATGIPEQQLRDMRQLFGSLDDAARHGQVAVTNTRSAANARGQTPGSRVHHMVVRHIDQAIINYRRAQEVQRAVQRLGQRQFRPAYPSEPPPLPPQMARFPRPHPLGPEGVRTGVTEISPAERAAHLQALAERGQQVRAARTERAARIEEGRAARRQAREGVPEGPALGQGQDISPAEREAHVKKLAERGKRVREAKEARARKIAEARAARQRPPEE